MENNDADIKPRISMQQNFCAMPSTRDGPKPFPEPCEGCNKQQSPFADPNMRGFNEILLRLDNQCDVNDNDIPGLFKYMEKHLPGYRFVPTDDQLVRHYLKKKIGNEQIPRCLIRDVNLYQHHPKELAEKYPRHDSTSDEWYFYTPRDRKYPNGSRPKRAAGNGYWKATGADKPVKVKDETVGYRQALVFYEGKPPKGVKTNWIMHEFKATEKRKRNSKGDMRLDDWVLCRIYYKKVEKPGLKNKEEVNNQAEEEDCLLDYDDDDILLKDGGCFNYPPENIYLDPDYLPNPFWNNGSFDFPFDQEFGNPNGDLV